MSKIIRLTEQDLVRLVKKVLQEQESNFDITGKFPGSREFIGMKFPLFKDMNEKTILYQTAKIGGSGVTPSHTKPLLIMQISDYPLGGYEGEPFTFNCNTGEFKNSRNGMKGYNKKLSEKLLNGMCKSKVAQDQWNKPPEMEKISFKS